MATKSRDIVLLDRAQLALEQATTVPEIAEVRNRMLVMERYLKRQRGAGKAARIALEIRLGAERKCGKTLTNDPKMRPGGSRYDDGTLKQLRITKQESSSWQRIAALPQKQFDREISQLKPSSASMLRLLKQLMGKATRKRRISKLAKKPVVKPGTLEPVPLLLVDPPWKYEFAQSDNRKVENQYPTMELAELKKLKIGKAMSDDAVMFMWATSPKLEEALELLAAWGLTYKTNMVWVKDKIGMGYYARQKHELLLVATKGEPPPPHEKRRPPSVFTAPRGRHSEKPEVVYEILEAMWPEWKDRRREMFARRKRTGWLEPWGNEA